VGLWKNIRKGWEKFLGLSRFEVGDGARTKFWHDMWCGDTVLKEAFLVLFGIAHAKDASVADNLELLGDSNQWSVNFSREAHDWEVDVFAFFFFSRYCTRLLSEEVVKIGCGGSPPIKACSQSGLSLALWLALWGVTFLGRVCGGLGLLRGRLFLCGR